MRRLRQHNEEIKAYQRTSGKGGAWEIWLCFLDFQIILMHYLVNGE